MTIDYKGMIKRCIPDKVYLKIMYKRIMHKRLDFSNPQTFNEKLQWLKIYDRNPQHTIMVDKYAAKKYVANLIGDQYIIPTIGLWKRFEEIDFDKLPNQFVLKCTHDSHGVVICKDKSKMNRLAAQKKLSAALNNNFYYFGREWPYKNVPPRIIAEKYMQDDDDVEELTDYKFYCFNGYVDCVMACFDRSSGDTKFYFFDKNWELKRINKRGKAAPADFTIPKPMCIDKMFAIASILSKGCPFMRVDLYECNGQIYFGEMTFYPDCGFDPNYLPETDLYFGNKIDLSGAYNYKKSKLRRSQ